jgi:hypothetical protein
MEITQDFLKKNYHYEDGFLYSTTTGNLVGHFNGNGEFKLQ